MLRPKALRTLISTLRAEGVCRYRLKTARGELELELFQQRPPVAAVEQAPKARHTEALRAEHAVPEPLRKLVTVDQFQEAQAMAARVFGE